MAHSNKKKKKEARGGLTKNQALKASRSARQAERLRDVLAWEREREERQAQSTTPLVAKRRTFSMTKSSQLRRIKVLAAREKQLL